jgi:Mrp family chromosome partitioning ATPase
LRDDVGASPTRDNPTLESHAEILRSDKIALAVIEQQNLLSDPEFSGTSKGWRTRIVEMFTGPSPVNAPTAIDLLDVFRGRLNVKRIGQSYVIEVSFRSPDRSKAARLANAVVSAYMADQINAKTEAAKVGAEWLEGRVADLRKQATGAARAVQDFKSRTDIVDQRRAQLDLSELESVAEMYKLVYAGYLQKLTETIQQQSVPLAESRVLNAAVLPNEPSHPKSKLIIALAALVGLLGGIGLSIIRLSASGRPFVTGAQLEDFGIELLGKIPNRSKGVVKLNGALFDAFSVPNSPFADSFRNIKTMLDLVRKREDLPAVIGVASAAPVEGRTTLAFNLAVALARSGRRTALVDADAIHAGSITHATAPACEVGLSQALSGTVEIRSIAIPVCEGCDVLPITPARSAITPIDFFTHDQAHSLFRELRNHYDIVIVDLPPPTRMDPRAPIACLDGYLLVAQPGRASLDKIGELAQTLNQSHAGVLGAIVNLGGRRRRTRHLADLAGAAGLVLFRKLKIQLGQRNRRPPTEPSRTI